MTRLIWITERHSPMSGGMAVSSTRLVNALRDRGHAVTVLHLTGRPDNGSDEFRFSELEDHWTAAVGQEDLERIFFLKRRSMEGCLIVGFGGGIPGFLASLWGRWLNTASVVMFRGNDLDRLTHDPDRGWLVMEAIAKADLVCAVARDMCTRIGAMRDGPVLFTPVGIIPEEWTVFPADRETALNLRSRHGPDGRPLVGVFGQLKYKKGLATVFDVFHAYGMGRYARLLTVGDMPDSERRKFSEECSDFWSTEPFVPRRKIIPYYLACDIVFIPSFYDGMPNVLLEAMVCGLPVVGSRAGGMPDVITDGKDGFLFDTGDSVAAAETLSRALSFVPEARRRIGEEARQTVTERFTGAREADILEAALTELVRG